jgi:hypothetical protein
MSRIMCVTLPSFNLLLTVPCAVLPVIRTDSDGNHGLCSQANAHLISVPAAHNIQVSRRKLNRLAQS